MPGQSWDFFDIDGIAVWKLGEGTVPIVTMHGGPGLSDYMSELDHEYSAIFAAHPDACIYRYQQRGLAPSPLHGPFTVEQHLRDFVCLLDGIGARDAVVVGHSWGGHLAMHAAVALPERVRAFVAIDPLGATGDGGDAAMGVHFDSMLTDDERLELSDFDNIPEDELTEEMLGRSLSVLWKYYFADPSTAPAMPDMGVTVPGYRQTWASVKDHFASNTLVTGLPLFQGPALFIAASRGPIPESASHDSAALMADAETVVLDTGHFPWLEREGVVGPIIADFLTRKLVS